MHNHLVLHTECVVDETGEVIKAIGARCSSSGMLNRKGKLCTEFLGNRIW